jgi:hypothetical protein
MTVPNEGYTYTIPPCLAPGSYLVRHEIIALHSAWASGEAQFYPSCHQLTVSGSGSVVPTEGLVSFPGAYKADEAGILLNVWNGTFVLLGPSFVSDKKLTMVFSAAGNYTIPGPAVFECPK